MNFETSISQPGGWDLHKGSGDKSEGLKDGH